MTSKKTESNLTEYERRVIRFCDNMKYEKWYEASKIVKPKDVFLFLDTCISLIQRNAFKGYEITLNDELTAILKKYDLHITL